MAEPTGVEGAWRAKHAMWQSEQLRSSFVNVLTFSTILHFVRFLHEMSTAPVFQAAPPHQRQCGLGVHQRWPYWDSREAACKQGNYEACTCWVHFSFHSPKLASCTKPPPQKKMKHWLSNFVQMMIHLITIFRLYGQWWVLVPTFWCTSMKVCKHLGIEKLELLVQLAVLTNHKTFYTTTWKLEKIALLLEIHY